MKSDDPLHLASNSNKSDRFHNRKMKHLAAYLLLGLGGNTSPSAKDVKEVLSSVGIDADDDRLDKLISELKGKDLQEVSYSWDQRNDPVILTWLLS